MIELLLTSEVLSIGLPMSALVGTFGSISYVIWKTNRQADAEKAANARAADKVLKKFFEDVTAEELAEHVKYDANGEPYLPDYIHQGKLKPDPEPERISSGRYRVMRQKTLPPDLAFLSKLPTRSLEDINRELDETRKALAAAEKAQQEKRQRAAKMIQSQLEYPEWTSMLKDTDPMGRPTTFSRGAHPVFPDRDTSLDIAECRCGAPYVNGRFTCQCPHPGVTPANSDVEVLIINGEPHKFGEIRCNRCHSRSMDGKLFCTCTPQIPIGGAIPLQDRPMREVLADYYEQTDRKKAADRTPKPLAIPSTIPAVPPVAKPRKKRKK